MKKNVPIIDLLILGLVVIAAAYFFLVHQPIQNETEQLETQISEVQDQLQYAAVKYAKYQTMQAAVDEALADGTASALPAYDNTNSVIRELGEILSSADSCSISFGDDTIDGNIARRSISVSFFAKSYKAAKAIVSAIEQSGNRFLIQGESLQLSFDDETGEEVGCSVSLSIVNFEYVEQ